MSSPSSSSRKLSQIPPSKGTPLQERSQSQTNRPPVRLVWEQNDGPEVDIFATSPYPTKPAHVLRPSTFRERRYGYGEENALQENRPSSRSAVANMKAKRSQPDMAGNGGTAGPNPPTVTLKRSVKTLRDLYEAQAERSRPSTAASPIASPLLRPSTAGSGLRSVQSREGLRGTHAWDRFNKLSEEDLSRLPSLDEIATKVGRLRTGSSPQLGPTLATSSSDPNLVVHEMPSSPPMRPHALIPATEVGAADTSSSSAADALSSSSPNFVRLGRSSSMDTTSAGSASPNVQKLGTSSPINSPQSAPDSDQIDAQAVPVFKPTSRYDLASGTSFAARMQSSEAFQSSPPGRPFSTITSSSGAETSDAGQADVTSSPPIQILVHTPIKVASSPAEDIPSQQGNSGIASNSHRNLQAAIDSSPAPSIHYPTVPAPHSDTWSALHVAKRPPRTLASKHLELHDSRLSTVPSEWSGEKAPSQGASSIYDDTSSDEDSFLEPPARAYLASSRVASGSTIRIVSDADRREASDVIGDLRTSEYRSPSSQPRSSSILSILTSSGSRSTARHSVDTRLSSMRSYTASGHNSLRSGLRPSSSGSIVSNLRIPSWARRYYSGGIPKDYFYSASQISSATDLTSRPSTSTPRTPVEYITSIIRPRTRSRLNSARQSHLEPGIGPLVSNPVRPRPASVPLHPADPRAHWAGVEEAVVQATQRASQPIYGRRAGGAREWSPHLHPDHRAGAHPRRSFWKAPSMDEKREILFNLRNAQVLGFILGFVFPISWFISAVLPLPPKPFLDAEHVGKIPSPNIEAQLQKSFDIAADIRYENARWWRGLNRFMCVVGVVVIAVVITLAILGTRAGGFSA